MLDRNVESPEYEEGSRYGLGLLLTEDGGDHWIRHGGSMIGHTCGMRVNVDAGLAVMVLTNGVADTADVQRYALELVRAGRDGTEPPAPPPLPEDVPDAARFAGTYVSSDGRSIDVRASGGELTAARDGGAPARVLRSEDDGFVVDADDWEPFPLWFREDGGRVASVAHGPAVYVPEGESPPKARSRGLGGVRGALPDAQPLVLELPHRRPRRRAGPHLGLGHRGTAAPAARRLVPGRRGPAAAGARPVRGTGRSGGPVLRVNYSGLDYFRTFTP